MPETQDEKIVSNFDLGRWAPSIDTIAVGSPSAGKIGDPTTLAAGRSYYVYTEPKPFDWYVFKFAFSWNENNQSLFMNIADMGEDEAMMLSSGPMSGLFGNPTQAFGAPLPYQYGYLEPEASKKRWAWAFRVGSVEIDLWWGRGTGDIANQFIAPYKVLQGNSLRFIVQNKSTVTDVANASLAIVGARWLKWGGEVELQRPF